MDHPAPSRDPHVHHRPVPPDATPGEEARLVAQTARALAGRAVVPAPADDVHVAAMGHRLGRFA